MLINSNIKKVLLSGYTVSLLITMGFVGILVFEGLIDEGSVEAASVLYVGGSGAGNYSSIQAAVNAANSGDTIYVYPGSYSGTLKIGKALTIIGSGSGNTNIYTVSKDVVQITSDWVNISKFSIYVQAITSYDMGIRITSAKNCKIEDCYFKDNWNNILLTSCSNITITNNTLDNSLTGSFNAEGIKLSSSSYNLIYNNTFRSNKDINLLLSSSSNNIIKNNIFFSMGKNSLTKCDVGIKLSSSSNNIIANNTCFDHNYNGIHIDGGANNEICNNTCKNNDVGIKVSSSTENLIYNNNCSNNSNYGIFITSSSNSTIINNTCNFNNNGINVISFSRNITVKANNCSKNIKNGIILGDSKYNNVSNNICDYNKGAGIWQYRSSNNTCVNNTFLNNYEGIFLQDSSSNILINNYMSSCGLVIEGDNLQAWNTHIIGMDNTINNKSILYLKDSIGSIIPPNLGQIILANCSNIIIENYNLSNGSVGIELGYSSWNKINNNTALSNNKYGLYIFASINNTITNNTFNGNGYGIHLSSYTSKTIFFDNFSIDKGWTGYDGKAEWERGIAKSGGGDPGIDHSPSGDNYIIGNNIGGKYQNSIDGIYWLTSPVIDCSNYTNIHFEFYRWLGIQFSNKDYVYVEVYDGTKWIQLWSNLNFDSQENQWKFCYFDISNYSSNNPKFQVRFGLGPTSSSINYSGWNIDDIKIYGYRSFSAFNYIYNNSCSKNNKDGIYLQITSLNNVSNNDCSNNLNGISIQNKADLNLFINNNCNNNSNNGIKIDSSSIYNNIKDNMCNLNNQDGILISHSNLITLANNICNYNKVNGIELYYSPNNIIKNNTCFGNNINGIFHNRSNLNVISNNNCNLNYNDGIYIHLSKSNIISNNTCNSNNNSGISINGSSKSIGTVFYDDFSTDKDWTGYGGTAQWERGPAKAGNGDPSTDYTPSSDNYIIGNNIGGAYAKNINPTQWLTSPIIDCRCIINVYLTFYRWLNIDRLAVSVDYACISVFNGKSWNKIWDTDEAHETEWNFISYNVSAYADNNPKFQIRFGLGPTPVAWGAGGWNIDDVRIIGEMSNPGYHQIMNNTCNSNKCDGIHFHDGSNNKILNNKFNNNNIGINLTLRSADCIIFNTSITNSSKYDFRFDTKSNVVALNCTFNKSKIKYVDIFSNLIVQWFLHVNVTKSNGFGIPGANITIIDNSSNLTFSGETDDSGLYRWIICTEYIENMTGKIAIFTPHNVTATEIAYEQAYAEPEPYMNSSKTLYLVLPNDVTPPDPPINLVFTAVGATFLNFSWEQLNKNDVYGYNIYINDTGSSTNFHLIGSTQNTHYNVTGLMEEVTYYFRIKSYDDVPLESTALSGFTTTLDVTPPLPPSSLVFTEVGGRFINLSWIKSSSSDIAGYQIFINDTGSSNNFHYLGNTINLFFNSTGLIEETTYYFKVRAFDEVPLFSIFTNIALGTTRDITNPAPPTSLIFNEIGGTFINISWTNSISIDIIGYQIYINNTGSTTSFHLLDSTSYSYFNYSGLPEETTYFFKVRAFDEVPLFSEFSNIIWTTTLDITPPETPTSLICSLIGGKFINITWTASSSLDVNGYEIYINDTDSSNNFHFFTSTTNCHFNHTGLPEETKFYYKIRAFDEVPLFSVFSKVASAITLDITPPKAPIGLEAIALSGTEISLTWNSNKEPDLSGYNIYINDTNNGPIGSFKLIHSIFGYDSFYKITDLFDETTYYFKINAFDEVPNNSSFSNIVSSTTLDETPPTIPTGLIVSNPTSQSLKISWEPNSEPDVIGYKLYRSLSPTASFVEINSELINDTQFIDSNLKEAIKYYYKLKAVDDVFLESEFSELASGITLLGQKPPEINNPIVDFDILEDSFDDKTINLLYWFKDVNADELTFHCEGQKYINVIIHQKNGTVILIPEKNWNGQETLTFYADDGIFDAISDSIIIKVTPVNDPPNIPEIIKPENGTNIEEGATITFKGNCYDPDLPYGDILKFKWSSDITGDFGEGENLTDIILSPGKHKITLKVIDKEGETRISFIYISILKKPKIDNDEDFIDDTWELEHGLNPKNPNDANEDPDNDKLSNIDEYQFGTNPQKNDTDSDGITDFDEINFYHTNATNPDTDGDGVGDKEDEYPLDNSKWKKEDEEFPDTNKPRKKVHDDLNWLILGGIIILILIIILIIFLIMKNKKIRKKEENEKDKIESQAHMRYNREEYSQVYQLQYHENNIQTIPNQEKYESSKQINKVDRNRSYNGVRKINNNNLNKYSSLSPEQKIELLEERLLLGHINKDLYKELLEKYEMELNDVK